MRGPPDGPVLASPMTGLLGKLLKVEPDEGRAVRLCLLQAVALGLPRLFTLTVAAALFLERNPAADVPWVYIAASGVLPAAGALHLAIGRRVPFVRMQLGTLLVLAAVPAGFLVLLRSSSAAWPAFALFVWCGAELHLSNIVLWSTANRIFTVRQGKRLFGLIGAGEVLAAIAGGAALPLLARRLGTADLLAVSVVGFLLTYLGFLATARGFGDRLAREPGRTDEKRSARGEVLSALRSPFLQLIFLTYALVLSGGFFVNSIFYFQVGDAFPSAGDLAVFLARFTAVASLLALVFRSLLSGRLLMRIGLVGGLVATPAALLAAALVVVHVGRTGLPSPGLFWSVVALRLLDRLLVGSLGQPAYYSLYQPLSRERRVRVQTAAETIAGPIAGGLAGGVLLFLTKGLDLGAVGLTAAFLPVLLLWLGVGVAVGRSFTGALSAALRRRGVTGSDLSLSDPASLRVLERGLESARPGEVLHCLRLLEEAEAPGLPGFLRRLADHSDATVRSAAFRAIGRTAAPDWTPFLSERLEAGGNGARGELVRALGACGREASRPVLERAFEEPDGHVRLGALVALLRHAGADENHPAARELDRLVRSGDARERASAALLLGEIGGGTAVGGLPPLLADDDPSVREAALRAAGLVGAPALLELVVRGLEDQSTRGEATRALLASPAAATEALVRAYQAPGGSPSLRRAVLQVLGRSRDAGATRFLVGELAFVERRALSEVLWSLHLCGFHAEGADRRLVESRFREEVRRGSLLVSARRDLHPAPGAELLLAALGQELQRTQKRIFLLLSFVHDSEALLRIWANFSISPALRDLALELFESRVDRAQARLALPVLAETCPDPALPPVEHLRRILTGSRPRAGEWVRACAVDAISAREDALSPAERAALMEDGDELVRRTARARWGERPGEGRLGCVVERVRVLRGAGLFREIDDEVLAELAPRLEEVAVNAGDEVGSREGVDRPVHVVAEGALLLEAPGEGSARLGPGQVFGELAALESEPSRENVTALEPSRLLRLSRSDLHDFMSTRIEVVRGVVAAICQRVRSAPMRPSSRRAAEPAAPGRDASGWADHGDPLSTLDRVLILKTAEIFSEVPDGTLVDVAVRTREVRLRRHETLFRMGDPGTTTYIVASGRLRIHAGDRTIAQVGERAVVGELAALSSEPRTASVTALEDSLLLTLDQESLFDLMLDQQEVARGILRVLVSRLRDARRAAAEGAGA